MNIKDIEHILKEQYRPAIENQIQTEPSPFLEKIKKTPLAGAGDIKWAAPIGVNGGFGFGSEGMNTPKAGSQNYADFAIATVDMYVNLEISNKTIQLANTDKAVMYRALDTEIKSSYETAKWNLGRSLFGNGSGKLCDVSAVAGKVLTVSDTSNLIEGLTIDLYAEGGTAPAGSARIVGINRSAKTVTLDVAPADYTKGFITVQGSYNKELCGIGAIFDDSVAKIYGKTKADNEWIKPVRIDAKNDITDLVLYEGVTEAKRHKRANIDMILCGDEAFKNYQEFMNSKKTQVITTQHFKGGATGYNVVVGDREVTIVNEGFVPSDKMWGVDTKQFELVCTPWNFVSHDGSSIFTLRDNSSIFRALLASYGNLICNNPGGLVEFVNCEFKAE